MSTTHGSWKTSELFKNNMFILALWQNKEQYTGK